MPVQTAPYDWLSDLLPAFAAQETWDDGTYNEEQTLQMVYASDGPFYVACGIGLLAEHVRRFRFSPEIIRRLGQVTDAYGRSRLHESFLNYLQRLHLTLQVQAAPEGTLLPAGTPMLILKGPLLQLHLMGSALRILCWESTHWATLAALGRWRLKQWDEEDTPPLPSYGQNPAGWSLRAAYIGGGGPGQTPAQQSAPDSPSGIRQLLQRTEYKPGQALVQIRRLFKGSQPAGDVWLTQAQEDSASVSKSEISFLDGASDTVRTTKFTRFQMILQPALVKGHPVLPASRPGYFRQRTLKQMAAFAQNGWKDYPSGWYHGPVRQARSA